MNKIIAVFLLFFLSSCANRVNLEGKQVQVLDIKPWETSKAYNYFVTNEAFPYRVFGTIVLGPHGGKNYVMMGTGQNLYDATNIFHKLHGNCAAGCIVTDIIEPGKGSYKVSSQQQKEIAKKFYPDHVLNQLFKNSDAASKKDTNPDSEKRYDWLNKYNDNDIIPAGSGTGFFINREGTLLTNYHVIQGCTSVALYHTGVKYSSNILASDRTNDIAILNSSKKSNQYFKVNKDGPELLEEIFVAGYPLGLKVSNALKVSGGRVSSLAGYGDNYSNFQIDAAMNPGNSGGPIINKKGNVVGIAVAQLTDVQGFNFGIKSSTVNSVVNSNKIYFSSSNMADMSSRDLSKLMNEATVFLECSMRVKDIKAALANKDSKKVFYSEFSNKN
jgi:hypothetical protein